MTDDSDSDHHDCARRQLALGSHITSDQQVLLPPVLVDRDHVELVHVVQNLAFERSGNFAACGEWVSITWVISSGRPLFAARCAHQNLRKTLPIRVGAPSVGPGSYSTTLLASCSTAAAIRLSD